MAHFPPPMSRSLAAICLLLAAALACNFAGQPPTTAATATPPAVTGPTQAQGKACNLLTSADVSLVLDNPPAPVGEGATVSGVDVQECSFGDAKQGAGVYLVLGASAQLVAKITALLPAMKLLPSFARSTANGAGIYVYGGPNPNGPNQGDALNAFIIKGDTEVTLLAGAPTYHYDSAKALAMLQAVAGRLP